jgi:hypothetical protein
MKPHYRLRTNGRGSWWMEQVSPLVQAWRPYSEPQHAIGRAGYAFWKYPGTDAFRDSLRNNQESGK